MNEPSEERIRTPRKKFKLTRQLIKIALTDGMKQADIAKICRVSQSYVSEWNNGSKLAYEKSLKPLRKVTSQLYQVHKSEEEMLLEKDKGIDTPFPIKFVLVEGKVILREKFINPERDRQGRIKRKDAQAILTVHEQGNNKFRCVIQRLISFNSTNTHPAHHEINANFLAEINELMEVNELIEFVRAFRDKVLINESYVVNHFTIDYLLLNALVMNGYQVKDIEVLPASW